MQFGYGQIIGLAFTYIGFEAKHTICDNPHIHLNILNDVNGQLFFLLKFFNFKILFKMVVSYMLLYYMYIKAVEQLV